MTTNPIPPPPAAPADDPDAPVIGSPEADALNYEAAFDALMDGADHPLPAFPAGDDEGPEPDDVSVAHDLAAMIRATMAGAAATMSVASRVAQAAEALERIADVLELVNGGVPDPEYGDDRRSVRGSLDTIAESLTGDGSLVGAVEGVGR